MCNCSNFLGAGNLLFAHTPRFGALRSRLHCGVTAAIRAICDSPFSSRYVLIILFFKSQTLSEFKTLKGLLKNNIKFKRNHTFGPCIASWDLVTFEIAEVEPSFVPFDSVKCCDTEANLVLDSAVPLIDP